jgi:hypothetical protein
MLLFIKKRNIMNKTRGSYAKKRFWRITSERLDNIHTRIEILKIAPDFLKGRRVEKDG